ncbi:hypothetical protein FH966_14015 [Lentibacillus cibarius]|uniref:LysM domain-containing protein n=1 Tax=Lentibacillus cibarius TaxID=2583219 RepID=A0A549YLH4_9BACI|nr:hypothetical protein [Lentibacillus cibarius]TRM12720.1 hypothetical protein FH966_14015 [Lentibacillus cibarius]
MMRFGLYIFIILFCVSIYKDLTIGIIPDNTSMNQNIGNKMEEDKLTGISMKVDKGDTILSVVEEINDHLGNKLDISEIMADFKTLNPKADPIKIQPGETYYFPVYKKGAE